MVSATVSYSLSGEVTKGIHLKSRTSETASMNWLTPELGSPDGFKFYIDGEETSMFEDDGNTVKSIKYYICDADDYPD